MKLFKSESKEPLDEFSIEAEIATVKIRGALLSYLPEVFGDWRLKYFVAFCAHGLNDRNEAVSVGERARRVQARLLYRAPDLSVPQAEVIVALIEENR